MRAVLPAQYDAPYSLLDVGCGYGGLFDYFKAHQLPITYTGIDICEGMIDHAKAQHPEGTFICGSVQEMDAHQSFDYVVCNGILTQKLTVSGRDMDAYAQALIKTMYAHCRTGIAFNVMTTHVDYQEPNLYYRNPVELLAWCMTTLSPKVRLDHSYPMFEYTLYVYRPEAVHPPITR